MGKFSKQKMAKLVNPIFEDIQNTFGVALSHAGVPIIVFTKCGLGDYPIVGMYWNGEEWIPAKWMGDGRFPSINPKVIKCQLDINLESTELPDEVLA